MKSIWVICKNTFREIIRDRILYGIVVFALLLLGFSVALGELSFGEQARISADFGFTGIQLGTCILSIFVGSSLVSREIEKQTILTLLARPITRTQFLLGKFFGLGLVILSIMAGLSLVLLGLIAMLGLAINETFVIALLGIATEALLLLAVVIFFGVFARPMMTVVFAASIFLLGHWMDSLHFFVEKSQSGSFKAIGKFITYIVPNLERFNWRSLPVYNSTLPATEVMQAMLYGIGWLVVLLTLSSLIFRKRDFV